MTDRLVKFLLGIFFVTAAFTFSATSAVAAVKPSYVYSDEERAAFDLIKLSDTRSFCADAVNLLINFDCAKIAVDKKDYAVYTTRDGKEPDKKNGTLYSGSVKFSLPPNGVDGAVLKVRVYYTKNGKEYQTPTLTHTYILGKTVMSRFNTLVVSLSTDPYNLYDSNYGVFVGGALRDAFIKANPGVKVEAPAPANFNLRGAESERPVFFEVFEPNGLRVVAQGAGIRVHGGWSRANDQKSLRVYARKVYDPIGDSGKFRYEFFPSATGDKTANTAMYAFDGVLLRNHGNDYGFGYTRDELVSELAKNAGFPDVSEFRPVAVFLNGKYYACEWLKQVTDKDRLKQAHNAPNASLTVTNFGEYGETFGAWLDSGEQKSVDALWNLVNDAYKFGLQDKNRYDNFCSKVDIENLALYYAVETFVDNRDWPNNNMRLWKCEDKGEDASDSPYLDGKWRFIMFDMEFGWGLYDNVTEYETLNRLLGKPGRYESERSRSKLLQVLLKNASFKELFVNTLCDLASDSFSSANALKAIDALYKIQSKELNRAKTELKYPDWSPRDILYEFAKKRPDNIYGQLDAFMGNSAKFTVSLTGAEGLSVKLNSAPISGVKTKSVKYYAGNTVTLTVTGEETGYRFKGWKMPDGKTDTHRTITVNKDAAVTALSEKIAMPPLYISEVKSGGGDYVKIYNPATLPASATGLFLTDDPKNLKKWVFPAAIVIQGGNELTLFCAKNAAAAEKDIVLNFNISSGETLILSDKDGNVLSKLRIPSMKSSELLRFGRSDKTYHINKQ